MRLPLGNPFPTVELKVSSTAHVAAAIVEIRQFPVSAEVRMYLLHTGKEVLKPSVSNGSFAHFSSCWEKWAVGDTFLMQSAAVDKKYASGGKTKNCH